VVRYYGRGRTVLLEGNKPAVKPLHTPGLTSSGFYGIIGYTQKGGVIMGWYQNNDNDWNWDLPPVQLDEDEVKDVD